MKVIISALLIISLASCGTLGGFDTIEFPTSKQRLVWAIENLYIQNPEFVIPDNLKHLDDWKKRGYGFLDSRIFYFKSSPEEMYYVTFVGDSNDSIPKEKFKTSIALRAVFYDQSTGWQKEDEFSEAEKERIKNRFHTEIIYKLEKLTNSKSRIDN